MKFGMSLSEHTSLTYAVLAARLEMPMEEVIRDALSLYWWVARERSSGSRLLVQRGDQVTELAIPNLDRLAGGPPIDDSAV